MSGQRHAPASLYPQERPGTHFTGGWVGPRVEKSLPNWDSIPDRPARSSVAIPTELPGQVTRVMCHICSGRRLEQSGSREYNQIPTDKLFVCGSVYATSNEYRPRYVPILNNSTVEI